MRSFAELFAFEAFTPRVGASQDGTTELTWWQERPRDEPCWANPKAWGQNDDITVVTVRRNA